MEKKQGWLKDIEESVDWETSRKEKTEGNIPKNALSNVG